MKRRAKRKEPARREYWIDEVVFTDDPLVTDRYCAQMQNRGGSGIVIPERDASGTWVVRRDILLEPWPGSRIKSGTFAGDRHPGRLSRASQAPRGHVLSATRARASAMIW